VIGLQVTPQTSFDQSRWVQLVSQALSGQMVSMAKWIAPISSAPNSVAP